MTSSMYLRVFTLKEGSDLDATSNINVELVKLYKNAAGPIRPPHSHVEVDIYVYICGLMSWAGGGSGGGGMTSSMYLRVFTLKEGFVLEATSNISVELVVLYKNAAGPNRPPHSHIEIYIYVHICGYL